MSYIQRFSTRSRQLWKIPALIVVLMTLFLLTGLGCRRKYQQAIKPAPPPIAIDLGSQSVPPLEQRVDSSKMEVPTLSKDNDYTLSVKEQYDHTSQKRRSLASAHRKTKTPEPEHGPMNFNPPLSMQVGDTITVYVAIRRPGLDKYDFLPTESDAKTKYGLQGTGPMQGVDVPVAAHMRVELRSGPDGGFKVYPDNPIVKGLELGGHAEWQWQVTALKAGPNEVLLLHSQRVPFTPGGEALPPLDDGTRPTTINVSVVPKKVVVQRSAKEYISENWKKIVGGILGAIGSGIVAAITRWWKNRDKTPNPAAKVSLAALPGTVLS